MRVRSDTKSALLACKRTHKKLKWDDVLRLYVLEQPAQALLLQNARKDRATLAKIHNIVVNTGVNTSVVQCNTAKMTTALLVIPNY